MKKVVFTLTAGLAAATLLAGCADSKKEQVQSYANKLARYAAENKDSLVAIYPAAEYAEEIKFTYQPDSITVTPGDTEGSYRADLGNGVYILTQLTDNGEVKLNGTYGLFNYSPDKKEFAKKAGAPIDTMSDASLAKAMIIIDNLSSELFKEYAESRKHAIKNLGFTTTKDITYMMEEGRGYYTLKNTTDKPIDGSEYTITWEDYYIGFGVESSKKSTEPGKDIPANGTIRLQTTFTGHGGRSFKSVTMSTPSQEQFFANYTPTGKEYQNYIDNHGADVAVPNKLSNGPYTIVGKLGGKYPIHLQLDEGMKSGAYYYDKMGPNNQLTLSVKSFNKNTGELVLEEMNDKGDVTGSFIGTLRPDAYTGTMTAYTGKSYKFDLTVQK